MKSFAVLVSLGLAAAATPAAAQVPAAMIERIAQADANGDGAVTRAEFLSFRAAQFERIDRNGDGYLTGADAPRFAARAMGVDVAALTAQFDADGDDRVSRAEFVDGPTAAFDRADADDNDIVTTAEIRAAAAVAQP